jgi:hypothetical protein
MTDEIMSFLFFIFMAVTSLLGLPFSCFMFSILLNYSHKIHSFIVLIKTKKKELVNIILIEGHLNYKNIESLR